MVCLPLYVQEGVRFRVSPFVENKANVGTASGYPHTFFAFLRPFQLGA
jgi:hypothetical protein